MHTSVYLNLKIKHIEPHTVFETSSHLRPALSQTHSGRLSAGHLDTMSTSKVNIQIYYSLYTCIPVV